MRRIFFDANVIIAGSASRRGAGRALMMLAEMGMFRMVVSRQVIDEVERNLRNKLPQGLPVMVELLGYIAPEIVEDPPAEALVRRRGHIETKDMPVLEAAVVADVDFIVTLNSRDFTPKIATLSGVPIVSPDELIERIRASVIEGLE